MYRVGHEKVAPVRSIA